MIRVSRMENRLVSSIVVAVFLGVTIHAVSPQKLELVSPGIPCKSQAECTDARLPANARCQSRYCICPDENGVPKNCSLSHIEAKNADYNPAAAGRTCIVDQDCSNLPNGSCNTTNHQCVCPSGFVMASKAWNCLPNVRSIGSSCEDTKQCVITNSTCRNNQCLCDAGFHWSDNGCWKTNGFGDPCTQKQECNHVENAECNEQSVCACAQTAVLNSNGERCLPVAKEMLDPCIESTQCSKVFGDSECIDKRCECRENNHFERSQTRCVSSRNLGDSCRADYECYQDQEEGTGQPQRCDNNLCTCNENFTEKGGKCMSSGASSLISGIFVIVLLARISLSTS